MYDYLNEKIDEADLVLVGIGSSFQYDWNLIGSDFVYAEFVNQVGDSNEYDQFLSFLQYYLLKNKIDDKLKAAYSVLANKIKNKNYFVVTTTIDDYIFDSALDELRVVTPCGGFRKLQCVNGCENGLFDLNAYYSEQFFAETYDKGQLPKKFEKKLCPTCGEELVFNQIGNGKYVEAGYLEQWQQYKTWLMGTMHRKVVILELGAGIDFPTIIRSPFEKMVSYNERATFFRIHPNMGQIFMDDEVKKRAFGIEKDVKDFLIEWK